LITVGWQLASCGGRMVSVGLTHAFAGSRGATPPARAALGAPGRADSAGDRPAPADSPFGLHRVADPAGVLPQAARRLDPRPRIGPDEVRVRVERLNLDAASYRQLHDAHGGDPAEMRSAVLEIIQARGKMHNPVTGSGGMLVGVVDEVGPASPLGLKPGDAVATLVSLTLTPLVITDGLSRWNGASEQVPCEGHAILFGRSIAAVLPEDLPMPLALAVLDVCGAPALTFRVVASYAGRVDGAGPAGGARERRAGTGPVVAVIGASGKSGSLSVAAARAAGAGHVIGVVPDEAEAAALRDAGQAAPAPSRPAGGLADGIVIADARDPVALAGAVEQAGGPADVTVVCVDVPGCEGGAILATAEGGTVIFFSMATSFTAAALGAEGLAADVTMLIGNGYVPGHAGLALDLARSEPAARVLVERRVAQ
jgi:L-erythro-3,5-diaminohexanoate dehydrogenase